MKNNKTLLITTLVCLCPMILSAVLYDRLPDQIAVHWDNNGVPNGYASKFFAAFGIPLFMAFVNIIANVKLDYDPTKKNASPVLRTIGKWCAPVLCVILMPVTLLWAINYKPPVPVITSFIVGILFIAVGNYLPKSKQSYVVGIKLPWTLNNTKNWNKTHHLAGYLWILGGLCMILNGFIRVDFMLPVVVAVMIILPCLYSFYLYTKGI